MERQGKRGIGEKGEMGEREKREIGGDRRKGKIREKGEMEKWGK